MHAFVQDVRLSGQHHSGHNLKLAKDALADPENADPENADPENAVTYSLEVVEKELGL